MSIVPKANPKIKVPSSKRDRGIKMKRLILIILLAAGLAGCGHPVTVGLALWLSQPKDKDDDAVVYPLAVLTDALPYAVNGEAYAATMTAMGGYPPYNWAVTTGLPPTGIMFTGDVLSGTGSDTAGDFVFTVTVTDSAAQTATQQLTLTLYDNLAITLASPLPYAINGQAYGPEAIGATGGTGNYTWSITLGSLPSGINLTTGSGLVTGNPSDTAGNFQFTVELRDDAVPPQTSSANLDMDLFDPINITTASLPYAINGVLYSEALGATGGTGNYSWSEFGSNLPSGLTIDATGLLSGTPSDTPSSFNFTAQVQDDVSPAQTDSQGLNLELYDQLQITTSSTLPSAFEDATYVQALLATGGDGDYTWSNPGGDLPAWLYLDTITGELSGIPPTDSSLSSPYSFAIEVSDGVLPSQTAQTTFILEVLNVLLWEDMFDDTSGIDNSSDVIIKSGYIRLGANVDPEQVDAGLNTGDITPSNYFGDTTWIAQTFTIATSGVLNRIVIYHDREVFGTDLTFEIRDVVGGEPGDTVLTTVTVGSPGGGWGWHGATFTNTLDVYPGQVYALVCRGTSSTTSQRATSDPDGYAGGQAFISTDSGGTWGLLGGADRDIGFGIYVYPFSTFVTPGTLESVTISPTPVSEWGDVSWNADRPTNTEVIVQLLYDNGGSWDPIPDGDLPGNSAGFNTSPIDLSSSGFNLSATTYPAIRLRGVLSTSDNQVTPWLYDWRITYKP